MNIDFIVKNGLQVNGDATVNGVDLLANDYATFTTLVSRINTVQDNVGAGASGYEANDLATYTTLQGEYRANDYNTYTTLVSRINTVQDNVGAGASGYEANDLATYTTLQGEYRANDYNTYTTLVSRINTVQDNVGAGASGYEANDLVTYTTLQGEYRANDWATYTTLVNEYQANDYSTFTSLQSSYRANDHATWSGLNAFASIKANSSITLTAGDGLSGGGNLTSSRTFNVDSTVVRTSGDQVIGGEKTFTDSIIVEGDLTINGNVTTISATNLEVTDRFIQLASNATGSPSADVGLYLNRGSQGNSAIYYDQTSGYFALAHTLDPASNSTVSPTDYANLRVRYLQVDSSDLVSNFNADLLDGQQGSYYLSFANATDTNLITLARVTSNGASTSDEISVGGINVDSGLLYADTTNSRIGINTVAPRAQLQISNTSLNTSTITTTTTSANQVLDSFAASEFRTAKYLVQVHDTINNHYHASEILVVHNGTTAYITEYAIVFSNASLASFDANISGGQVRLVVTPTNATNTIKTSRTAITV